MPSTQERARKPSPSAERGLLFGVWAVVFLIIALWKFWPDANRAHRAPIPVNLAKELRHWFADGTVAERLTTHYVVKLPLLGPFKASIREPRLLQVGFALRGETKVLFRATAPCLIDGSDSATIQLPNPDRISARDIELYLPH